MIEKLLLSRTHWETMRLHVQRCLPMEGCGLLAGIGDEVHEVFLIQNAERSPTRFRMDAQAQLKAFRDMEERGLDLVGIFHSHPADHPSEAVSGNMPSATDIVEAAYPAVHVIWTRQAGKWNAQGFWLDGAEVRTVQLLAPGGE